jgi:hypothetical protein
MTVSRAASGLSINRPIKASYNKLRTIVLGSISVVHGKASVTSLGSLRQLSDERKIQKKKSDERNAWFRGVLSVS